MLSDNIVQYSRLCYHILNEAFVLDIPWYFVTAPNIIRKQVTAYRFLRAYYCVCYIQLSEISAPQVVTG